MKKIIIIQSSLPQYRKEFYILLKKKLVEQDIELHVIYGKASSTNKLRNDEIILDWAKYIQNKYFKIGNKELLWQPYISQLKDSDLVIVDAANRLILNYYLIIRRAFSSSKLAFWDHGRNLQEDIGSLGNRFKYLYINKCDWWFGYTAGTKRFLLSKKYPENRITVVQNTIDTFSLIKYYTHIKTREINELKSKMGIQNCKTAIYCGSMYAGKNIDFIIETCHEVKKKIPEFHVIFIGAGTEATKVMEAALSFDWIHYVGSKFGNERVIFFKIASIQLMPYYVGLGIVDSFAMETPIITTSNSSHGPEIEYLENEINGIMTEDSLQEYSKSVIEILKNGKYLQLINGCKTAAKKYSVEAMVENFSAGVVSCLELET